MENIQNISERILFISKNENISIRALEEMVGTSQGVLNKIVKNDGDLKCGIAARILELFPHYSADWFICNKGNPLRGDHQEPFNESTLINSILHRVETQAIENNKLNEKLERFMKQQYERHPELRIANEPDSSEQSGEKNK